MHFLFLRRFAVSILVSILLTVRGSTQSWAEPVMIAMVGPRPDVVETTGLSEFFRMGSNGIQSRSVG
jgi:hypothetical protein